MWKIRTFTALTSASSDRAHHTPQAAASVNKLGVRGGVGHVNRMKAVTEAIEAIFMAGLRVISNWRAREA